MLKIVNITRKFDKEMGEIIKDCLEEYGLNKAGTAWEDPYLDKFSEYYKDIKGEYFIALLEDKDEDFVEIDLVGGCGYGPLNGVEDTCELQKLYLKEEFRGLGIGRDLLLKVESEAKNHYKKIYLETAENMVEAIKFYEKNGYKRIEKPLGNTGHCSCGVLLLKDL